MRRTRRMGVKKKGNVTYIQPPLYSRVQKLRTHTKTCVLVCVNPKESKETMITI